MKKILVSIFALLIVIGIDAQKTVVDGNVVVKNVGSFSSISVASGIDLYLSQGNEEKVAISAAKEEDLDKIVVEVVNGTLKIYYEWKSNFRFVWGDKKMKAYVSFSKLEKLSASGGSDVFVEGTIEVPKFNLQISGGADFRGKIAVMDLIAEASGGSDIDISGKAVNARIDVSGGSDFKGNNLQTENCDADASGGSDIYVTVIKELKADASGGSDIYYKGSANVKSRKSGGSDIVKRS